MAKRPSTAEQSWVHAPRVRSTVTPAEIASAAELAAFFSRGDNAERFTVPARGSYDEAVFV